MHKKKYKKPGNPLYKRKKHDKFYGYVIKVPNLKNPFDDLVQPTVTEDIEYIEIKDEQKLLE